MTETKYYDSTVESPPATMDQYYSEVAHRIIVERIQRYGNNLKILDIGCGEGLLGSFLLTNNDVHGVEIYKEKVERCLSKGIKAKLIKDDVPLPYTESSFDVITCCEVLEHLLNPFSMVKETSRLLKKGGLLIITVPNMYDLRTRIRFPLGLWTKITFGANLGHIRFYSKKTLAKLIEDEGFTVESCITHSFTSYATKPFSLFAYFLALMNNPLNIRRKAKIKLKKQQIYQNINLFLTKTFGFTSLGGGYC